jgi:hypothetical protein
VTLLWAVPVVAAALATLLVVTRARSLEDEAVGLAHDAARLHDIRSPLASVRAAARETDELVAAFRQQHPLDDA